MITINLLQPIGPSAEYKLELNDAIISPVVLDVLLGQMQVDLDDICDEVIAAGGFVRHSEKMQILCQGEPERTHLKPKTRSGKYSLGPEICGGESAETGFKNLDGLKTKYKQLFRAAKENFKKCSPNYPALDIYVQLNFFRDVATKEIDSFYPDET